MRQKILMQRVMKMSVLRQEMSYFSFFITVYHLDM